MSMKEFLEENGGVKESWYWDIEELQEQLKEIQRKIRLFKKERQLQPAIATHSVVTGKRYTVTRYQIIDLDKSIVLAEAKSEIVEERHDG